MYGTSTPVTYHFFLKYTCKRQLLNRHRVSLDLQQKGSSTEEYSNIADVSTAAAVRLDSFFSSRVLASTHAESWLLSSLESGFPISAKFQVELTLRLRETTVRVTHEARLLGSADLSAHSRRRGC